MMKRSLFFFFFALLVGSTPAVAQTNSADAGVAADAGSGIDEDPTGTRIRTIFSRVPELSAVTVTHGDGVVSLDGTVPRAETRAAAETLAAKVEGVLWVDNRIRVEGEQKDAPSEDPTAADAAIRERLEGIFANVPELKDVDVKVHSGVVRLDGRVVSSETVEKAEELAKSLDGVVYVDNGLDEAKAVQERISPAFKKAREVMTDFIATLPLFAVAIVIFFLFYAVAGLVTRNEFVFRRLRDKPLIQGIARQLVRIVIVGAGIVLVLELFDLTSLVGAVLGTAGVAGLAVGFAFKDIVENYLASLMLSVRQPFDKNDVVKIDDFTGKVVRLSTRDTVLMTLDGNHLRLPNSLVFKAVILNYSRNPLRRFDFVVGIGVGEDITTTMKLGLDTVKETTGVLADPKAFVVVDKLGDFTVDLHFYAWLDQRTTDFAAAKSSAIRRVKEAYDAESIDMPEPTQRILHRVWEPPEPKAKPVAPQPQDEEVHAPITEQIDEQIEADREASDEPDLLQ